MTLNGKDKLPSDVPETEPTIADLKSAFLDACAREGFHITIESDANSLRLIFEEQAGQSGERLHALFNEEMTNAGIDMGAEIIDRLMSGEQDPQQFKNAFREALGMLRKRLVDLNSFTSGHVAYPFDPPAYLFGKRGIALYRYPIPADVELAAGSGRVSIRFAPGDLGEITSSGFWVPTWLAGDFDIRMRYSIKAWETGDKPACFGMWIANKTTGFTCYAQRTTEPPEPTKVGALMGDLPLHHAAVVDQDEGELRIKRESERVTALYRNHGDWLFMADIDQEMREDMIFGAKIWSHGECGPLEAEISDIIVSAALSPHQDTPPPFVEDARCLAEPIDPA